MRLDEFSCEFPPDRIAQRPLHERDASRMLILNRGRQGWEDSVFRNLPDLLRGDELIVVNNARVIPARLLGRRLKATAMHGIKESVSAEGEIEVLLSHQLDDVTWEALVRPGKKLHVGQRVQFGGELKAEVIA